jgi:hypothetical protein
MRRKLYSLLSTDGRLDEEDIRPVVFEEGVTISLIL